MGERPGIVLIAEDPEGDDSYSWSGRFSVRWESADGESFMRGPDGVSAEEAIRWGREHADVVLIRPGDSDAYYSAGMEPPPPDCDVASPLEWRAGTEIPRRRWRGFEHLDLVAEDEIAWEVRMEATGDFSAEPDGLNRVLAAMDSVPGTFDVEVVENQRKGLALRLVVRARNHADALRQALVVQHRFFAAVPAPSLGIGGTLYVGFDPGDDVRPLSPPR
jgi:hypothetical protein